MYRCTKLDLCQPIFTSVPRYHGSSPTLTIRSRPVKSPSTFRAARPAISPAAGGQLEARGLPLTAKRVGGVLPASSPALAKATTARKEQSSLTTAST